MQDSLCQYYCSHWNLREPSLIAETATSHVYRVGTVDGFNVLKLLTPLGITEEGNGPYALKYFAGNGAVRVIRFDHRASLLEFVDGEALISLVRNNQEDKATEILCEIIKKLHQSRVTAHPQKLLPLQLRFHQLLNHEESHFSIINNNLILDAAKIAHELISHPLNSCPLHGDLHHENVLHSSTRGWLAIDPKGLLGESTYDAANIIFNPSCLSAFVENPSRLSRVAATLAESMSIDVQRLYEFSFCQGILRAIWKFEDNQDYKHDLNVAKIIRPLI